MATLSTCIYQPTFGSQLRAFTAVVRKDWIQYWRYPLNAVSTIFQPIIWLTPAYFMSQAFSVNGQAQGFAAYSGTADYISFILIGQALGNFIMAVFWGMGYALKNDMDAGVLESNWLCPVSRILMLIGRTVTSMLVTSITSLTMLVVAGLVFGFHPSGNAIAALLTLLPMLAGLYGFGFAFAALVLILREANTLVDMSSYIVQTFSGSSFPIDALPRWLMPLSLAIPLTYGYDAIRGFLLQTRTILPIQGEIGLLIVFMVVMVIVGVRVFNWLERRVRLRGTLGQH